jgi:uncharacterized membrane protein YdfJ with MMPL/SSD domain
VTLGQAETGRVITAAATIMILVFLSFLFEQQLIIDQFGVSGSVCCRAAGVGFLGAVTGL